LNRLFCFFTILKVVLVSTVRNHTDKVVNHKLIFNGLSVIAKLKEVVGDLLIYIDFVLEFFTKFQSFSLVVYGFFIVFEAL